MNRGIHPLTVLGRVTIRERGAVLTLSRTKLCVVVSWRAVGCADVLAPHPAARASQGFPAPARP
jgi:hypothetical protein